MTICFLVGVASAVEPRILAHPDILAVSDSAAPHVEMTIAADPKDVTRLIAASIVLSGTDEKPEAHVYSSKDRGATWSSAIPPEIRRYGGADPQVTYDGAGSPLFAALATVPEGRGRERSAVLVFRSTGFDTWSHAKNLDSRISYDHEQMVADWYSKRFRNSVYVAALFGFPNYSIAVWRTRDGGRTWSPRAVAMTMQNYGLNDITPVVLSDGTLLVFAADFPNNPNIDAPYSNVWAARSDDGGKTFSVRWKVGAQYNETHARIQQEVSAGDIAAIPTMPSFAADSNPNSRYKDRVYEVWCDRRSGRSRLFFSRSEDRGRTWSSPALVDSNVPAGAEQFQQAISVNRNGDIAVTWFDSGGASTYREFATVSLDGGNSFLGARALSSATSNARAPGNMIFQPEGLERIKDGHIGIYFVSALSRWPSGGDYMGLAADNFGAYHAFWADSRFGSFQPYTSTFQAGFPPKTPPLKSADVSKEIQLIFASSAYDAASGKFRYAVRLKNVGKRAIYGPLTVTISNVQNPYLVAHKQTRSIDAPVICDASNAKAGNGATFGYAKALGDFPALQPDEMSGAAQWCFKAPFTANPYLGIDVHGFVQ